MYNAYTSGKHVYLRYPTDEDALGKWHEWFSDEQITKYMGGRFWPNSKEDQLAFLKSLSDKSRLVLSVVTVKDDTHIGVVGLSDINWVHRYAEISIVIGEKEYHKGAYAVEAFDLLLKVAFNRLNLRNIKSGYAASNEASKLLHKLFKFNTVGEYKGILFVDGHWDDVVVSMINREMWLSRKRQE